MMFRRTGIFYLALVMAFIGLLFRTFWLGIGENAAAAETAVNSRERQLLLYRTRGLIYDEALQPIAGDQPCWYLVVNPRDFKEAQLDTLVRLSGSAREALQKKLKKETPFVLKSETEPPEMEGVQSFEGVCRYSGIAQHLLGYLDSADEVGLSGIEKEYNAYLNLFSSSVTVSYRADAARGAMAGLGMEITEGSASRNGLVLTLDKEICGALDAAMEEHIGIGAAVVMECKTGEIKAVTSRPGYEEAHISDYMQSTAGELINRAFTAQTVGSVFKIVVAACALEVGLEDFRYFCEGGILINDRTFACNNHTNHIEMDLQEALAQSCNAYFIALGQLLGYDRIIEMAERFGFGEAIGLLGSMEAVGGNLPEENSTHGLANLSIGQGELMASPLQIARMTAVIANGGVMPEAHIYKGIYLNNTLKTTDEILETKEVISAENAEKLRQYCVYTVEKGTGANARPEVGSAGGKTSSAQTGVMENGVEKLNVYFTGFYPAEDPQYIITIFAENGVSGGKTCAPVFRKVCDFIAKNGLTE